MKVKVFYPDRDGNIRFSKKELEDLLDEVYREGYMDGRNSIPHWWTYTTPNWYYTSNGTITTSNPRLNDSITYSTASNSTYTSNTATISNEYNDENITNVNIDLSALKYKVEYK